MISAVILSKNNENTLRRTIESLSWCSEIIIIDDNSIDNTLILANKYGARIITNDLDDDFSKQRNLALKEAKFPWVFFVDSDEIVTEELSREIDRKIRSSKGISGFSLRRQDIVFGKRLKYGETSRVKFLRLGRKEAGKWYRPVHEEWRMKGVINELESPILHYPFVTVAQFLEKINVYSSLKARYLYQNGVKIFWWQIIVYPAAKFVKNYLVYQGFRDGTAGIIHAIMMSFHSFLTRAKLWQLWDTKTPRT